MTVVDVGRVVLKCLTFSCFLFANGTANSLSDTEGVSISNDGASMLYNDDSFQTTDLDSFSKEFNPYAENAEQKEEKMDAFSEKTINPFEWWIEV